MIVDVTCKTDRFNLSVVRSDFINDCCFGEDFSRWLVAAMLEVGIEAHVLGMEDFGWANQATCEGASYLVCVAGNSDGDPCHPDYGEWHVMFERRATWTQKLFQKNKASATDPVIGKVVRILQASGLLDVVVEP